MTFAYLNLAGANYPSPLTNTTNMDLILCRNVLIYFPPATTQHVVCRLYDALAEDGWLIVGHAEPSQEVFRQFVSCNFPDTVVYRKQAPVQTTPAPLPLMPWPVQENLPTSRPVAPPPRMPAPASAPPQSALRLPAPPPIHPLVTPAQSSADARSADALALATAGEYDQASQQLAALAAPPVNDGVAAFHLAQLLAGRGKLAEAERWVQVAVERAPLLAEAHYLHSLLFTEAGQPDAALTALRRCIYVDAAFELAHFSLAALYQRQQQAARALRELQLTVSLLASRDATEPLRGGDGLLVGRLRQMATARMAALTAAA